MILSAVACEMPFGKGTRAHPNQGKLRGKVDEIYRRYASGETTRQLAAAYGVNYSSIEACLRRNGCKFRSASEAHRKHSCDDAFFEAIDDHIKAYWLGFIAADGCVKSGGTVFHINLQIGDREHLQQLRRDMKATNEVKVHAGKVGYGPIASFFLTSKELCDGLIKNGIVPRKSLILEPPTLPNHLVPHYIRGYFDGDGCISGRERAIKFLLVGTEAMMNWMAASISDACGFTVAPPVIEKGKSIWTIRVHGAGRLTAIREYLYPDVEGIRSLSRKRSKFQEVRVRSQGHVEQWRRRDARLRSVIEAAYAARPQ